MKQPFTIVILSESEEPVFMASGEKQVLRFAQNDNSAGGRVVSLTGNFAVGFDSEAAGKNLRHLLKFLFLQADRAAEFSG